MFQTLSVKVLSFDSTHYFLQTIFTVSTGTVHFHIQISAFSSLHFHVSTIRGVVGHPGSVCWGVCSPPFVMFPMIISFCPQLCTNPDYVSVTSVKERINFTMFILILSRHLLLLFLNVALFTHLLINLSANFFSS